MIQEATFSQEQITQRSMENTTGFILANLAYLRERGQSVDEWAAAIGQLFAPGWEDIKGQGARAAMEQIALNVVSGGATLDSLSGDENHAEAVVSGWPPQDFAQFLGLWEADIEPFWGIFGPIAEYLGLQYEYQRQDGRVTFKLSR